MIWIGLWMLLTGGAQPLTFSVVGGTWPLAEWKDAFENMHSGQIAKSVLVPE